MTKEIMNQTSERMEKAHSAYTRQLASIRAGRANASLLDRISVIYYGAPTPLNQMAGISVPEPRLIVVQPYDKTTIGEIEKAIMKSDIGITPSNDGSVIRLAVPALTEERRKELVKEVKREAEDAKVAIRNVRRDSNEELKKIEKDGEITEDELRRYNDQVQKMTDDFIEKIDQTAKDKENEILEI
ncbi:ribosome recycling factor [Mammaliicoccus sciuri]|uniref:Ribosome-recycling factor n=2 Tax=Sporosarcina newyorkensis TaxID=759851 RepID=A0A1T4YE05_9BACL|nr:MULTISPECIES: ribosome recycling factor [Sporosarcina]EGQ27357.1 ribosome recycling factor [Sporosarcina newyorkensis 2681]MBY0222030.1 ribosome recycling factor [Sporosarcina aquimarina]SKA99920.1 ribosome recycling factor [Sporosarcina newyorkensis]